MLLQSNNIIKKLQASLIALALFTEMRGHSKKNKKNNNLNGLQSHSPKEIDMLTDHLVEILVARLQCFSCGFRTFLATNQDQCKINYAVK